MNLDPVAVVLDLMEPLVAGRSFGFRRGELGLDESGISEGFEPWIFGRFVILAIRYSN